MTESLAIRAEFSSEISDGGGTVRADGGVAKCGANGTGGAVPPVTVRSVVSTLRVANIGMQGAASAGAVVEYLCSLDREKLIRASGSVRLVDLVRAALEDAARAGEIERTVGRGGHATFLHPEAARRLQQPSGGRSVLSRRQRTLALVREAARALGRAVRFCDVMAYRDATATAGDIPREAIARDIQSLCKSGAIIVAREVLGGGADGQYFYLPEEHAAGSAQPLPVPQGPVTWLEHAAEIFRRCWIAECDLSIGEGRRPRPLPTAVLRTRLLEETDLPQARDEQLVCNALVQLSKAQPPVVRSTGRRQGSHFAMWVPATVDDTALDLGAAFPSDAARIVEAARRAVERTRLPAVGRREVEAEMQRNAALRPNGASTVAQLLADVSKELVDAGTGDRRKRAMPVLFRVGRVAGEAYYSVPGAGPKSPTSSGKNRVSRELDTARRYLDVIGLESKWQSLGALPQVGASTECLNAVATVGRLRVVHQGVAELQMELRRVRGHQLESVPGVEERLDTIERETVYVMSEADRYLERALHDVRRRHAWSADLYDATAVGVMTDSGVTSFTGTATPRVNGMTLSPDELLAMVRTRGYARALRATDPTELVPLLAKRVLRIENLDFAGWRKEASEFLFERTDAMLFAAREWGGGLAVLYSQIARQELGQLRDARYVRAGLLHPRYDARMASAAALAFLAGEPETDAALTRTTMQDPDAGVRRAALWAYGAACRPGLDALLERVLEHETHRDVVALARAALADPKAVWWTT